MDLTLEHLIWTAPSTSSWYKLHFKGPKEGAESSKHTNTCTASRRTLTDAHRHTLHHYCCYLKCTKVAGCVILQVTVSHPRALISFHVSWFDKLPSPLSATGNWPVFPACQRKLVCWYSCALRQKKPCLSLGSEGAIYFYLCNISLPSLRCCQQKTVGFPEDCNVASSYQPNEEEK